MFSPIRYRERRSFGYETQGRARVTLLFQVKARVTGAPVMRAARQAATEPAKMALWISRPLLSLRLSNLESIG
jgi:hypothetical protein